MRKPYEAPVLRVVGTIQQLTLITGKNSNNTADGFSYQGAALTS